MQPFVLIIHVIVALFLVGLVLMQHGKGADIGAAFGSGASNTMFGSAGSTPFLMKITIMLAAIFFVTSISLSYLVAREQGQQTSVPSVPVVPTQPAPSGLPDTTPST